MLVDNAIVVLENIFRHRENGKGPKEAAVRGSSQVGMAITSSTLTTLAVFVPVLFLTGVSSVTFQQLAYVVSFSLLCSLVVALTLVPVMCSKFLKTTANTKSGPLQRVADWFAKGQEQLAASYGNAIGWALGHRATVLSTAALLFVGAIMLAPLIGVELQPEADEGELRVDVEMEPGTRVEVTDELMQRMARITQTNVPEARFIMIETGGGSFSRGSVQHTGELRVQLVEQDQRDRSAKEIADVLRPKLAIQPGVVVRTRVSSGMYSRGMGSSQGDRLVVEIRGHNFEILQNLAFKVRDAMASVPGVPEVQIGRQPGMPEMVVRVDRIKAATMGLNVSDIAEAMETAIGGRRTSMYRQEGDEFNILVRLQERDRLKLSQVGQIPLATPLGQTIPASNVIQMTRQEGPVSIERADQERLITVSGTLGDRDLGSVVRDLDEKLRAIPRPIGYEFRFGGEYEEQEKTFRDLTFAAILALILVYMVMAAQFESLRDPFIILFSIPLAAVGVTGILVMTNTTFNMQGFLGVIILVGIVVNNAIILIDYMNQLRREHGYKLRDAVIAGGTRRLRPILMTTTTTLLGLGPMALGIGEGSELQAPLARVVIGGLATSTLITLIVIPVERSERAEEAAPARADALRPVESPGD
jgi:HAE1 family hydrophobic/amphiphilic exporter-1